MASDLYNDIIGDTDFIQAIEPVARHELIMTGELAVLYGMAITSDAYRHPEHRVLSQGEFFAISDATTHGQYTDRGGIDTEIRTTMKLDKHYRALDHVIVAMASLSGGKPVLAAKHFQQAMTCEDFEQTLAMLDNANEVKAKPTLAQALTIVAAKAKPKKKSAKKPFGGKQAPPFKKKAKANTLTIAEVDLDDDSDGGLTEDDLLLEDDEMADVTDVAPDTDSMMDDDGDIDLDSLSLDDSEEMADFDLDDDSDESDDVMEMPEATSAETLGTDAEIKPGSDGTPSAQDVSETDTQPKSGVDAESQIAKTKSKAKADNSKVATAAARRLLANLHVIERQSAAAQSKVKK
jgi:hypothetical protein